MKLQQDIVNTVNNIVAQVLCCNIELITEDKNMYYDLLADSLSMLDIFISLEQTYSINYSEDDMVKVEYVKDIYTFVNDKLSKG